MIVYYRWRETPRKVKIFDAVKARAICPFAFANKTTQEDYDKATLKSFASKKESGLVLEYSTDLFPDAVD